MADWQTLSSENVYETPWITVRRDEVINHANKPLTYSVVDLKNPSVFILALNENQEILLQKHYRYTINQEVWSLPAGHSDGQNLLEAAQRELAEEAGLASQDWVSLGKYYQAIGIGNLPLEYFLARNVYSTKHSADETEQIFEHRFVSLTELEDMICAEAFKETTILAALYLAKARGLLT